MRSWIVIAVCTAMLLGSTQDALAYCRTTTCNGDQCDTNTKGCVKDGVNVLWRSMPLPYRISSAGSKKLDDTKMRKALRAAFATWSTVMCDGGQTSLRFREGDDIDVEKPAGISAQEALHSGIPPFGIYFRDKGWDDSDSTDAMATTGLAYLGSKPNYVDIELNTENFDFSFDSDQADTDDDFQTVITHEIGHYIGIAHSDKDDSIMAPTYCQTKAGEFAPRCEGGVKNKRALAADDEDAVCNLYPNGKTYEPWDLNDALTGNYEKTTGGCSVSEHDDGSTVGQGAIWAAIFAVGVASRRRLAALR